MNCLLINLVLFLRYDSQPCAPPEMGGPRQRRKYASPGHPFANGGKGECNADNAIQCYKKRLLIRLSVI